MSDSKQDPPNRQALTQALLGAVEQLELDLPEIKQQQLIDYLLELSKWNRTYNLTAIRTVDDMLVLHLLDCLTVVPAISVYEVNSGHMIRNIIDVGSGAGLPAVVLAITRPDVEVVSVDAVQKKSVFVKHIANKLGLVNLTVHHDRIEAMTNVTADLIISRAFASLSNFIASVDNIVSPNTRIAAMKSKQVATEIQQLKEQHPAWTVEEVVKLNVPLLDAERFLVWVRRNSHE